MLQAQVNTIMMRSIATQTVMFQVSREPLPAADAYTYRLQVFFA